MRNLIQINPLIILEAVSDHTLFVIITNVIIGPNHFGRVYRDRLCIKLQ